MKDFFGVCEWYLASNGPSAIQVAAKMGFDGIQITDLGGSFAGFPLNDRRLQELYLEEVASTGITLHALQSMGMNRQGGIRNPVDSPEGELALINAEKSLKVCQALSIPVFFLSSFDICNFRNDYELNNTIKMLQVCTQMAVERGIRPVWEPFCATDKTLRVLEQVGDNLKLCYDTLNPIRFGFANPSDELRQIGVASIDHVHAKDAPENMVGCWPLGQGSGKFDETMSVLKELGYSGWFLAENYFFLPPMNTLGDGWELAQQDLEYLRLTCRH